MDDIIIRIASKVRSHLKNAEGGHNWWHIERVWRTSSMIAKEEDVNTDIVSLAALLHDIADPKFIGPRLAKEWLALEKVDPSIIEHVVNIIKHMSYKNSLEHNTWTSPELLVVQDADRLDAIGAIGIARAFNYGGHKHRELYNPDIPPLQEMTKEQYKSSQSPTINHFYEKLIKLRALMNTRTGQALAQQRHEFMMDYLEQFYKECGSTPDWHKAYLL